MRALVIAVSEVLKSFYRNHHPLIALCSFCKVTELSDPLTCINHTDSIVMEEKRAVHALQPHCCHRGDSLLLLEICS